MNLGHVFPHDCYHSVRVVVTVDNTDNYTLFRVLAYRDALQIKHRRLLGDHSAEIIGEWESAEKAQEQALEFQEVMVAARRLLGISQLDPDFLLQKP